MLTENDIAALRKPIEDPTGPYAKAGPTAQAKALAEFDARIEAGRLAGHLGTAPAPIDAKEMAEQEMAAMFPSGADPIGEGMAELLAKSEERFKDLSGEQLAALADQSAKELGETREAEYEADSVTFKRWRVLTGSMRLDRLIEQANVPADQVAKLKANLPALKIKAALGQRNVALAAERKRRGI